MLSTVCNGLADHLSGVHILHNALVLAAIIEVDGDTCTLNRNFLLDIVSCIQDHVVAFIGHTPGFHSVFIAAEKFRRARAKQKGCHMSREGDVHNSREAFSLIVHVKGAGRKLGIFQAHINITDFSPALLC